MKCPLLAIGGLAARDAGIDSRCDCLKADCAWWDEKQECCVICTIAGELGALHYFAKSIRDKMPPAKKLNANL